MGMSPAQWLRTAALSKRMPPPPVPEVNRKAYGELARLGVNLNQIAKAANAGRTAVPFGLLRELLSQIMCLQASLMGVAGSSPPEARTVP
ncbi:MAG: MobC family plasmid mobilization relaxosome protein [Desulfovibrio sp.]|uniref:plasmid mobilization protein n=1 Tax=Desulfovibrio sp. TaxID=885 RepID=UPI00135EDF3E|nr:MobC family plasmid mobilization relaxosome protein [Desulfovibrio sp.]